MCEQQPSVRKRAVSGQGWVYEAPMSAGVEGGKRRSHVKELVSRTTRQTRPNWRIEFGSSSSPAVLIEKKSVFMFRFINGLIGWRG